MNKQAKGIIWYTHKGQLPGEHKIRPTNVEQYNTLDSTKRSNIFSPCFLSLLRPKVALIISLCLLKTALSIEDPLKCLLND